MTGAGEVHGGRWARVRNGQVLFDDTEEHVALVLRTLGIDEAAWSTTLDRYAESAGAKGSVDERLAALAAAFRAVSPHALPAPGGPASHCPACSAPSMRPAVARRSGPGEPPLIFGACERCGHGQLLAGAAPSTIYQADAYFQRRGPDGVGYDDYANERPYRQAKGARLLDWIQRAAGLSSKAPSLLEVGSGFGFTLGAAAARGWRATGVDINPAAARGAAQLDGVATVTDTLGGAIERGAVARGAWDIVLYQFVLEHLLQPEVELHHAAEALAPGGHLAVVVPNMSTFELDVFGASYRSLRADHLHLFSMPSVRHYLAAERLAEVVHETTCSLHLLRGFLEPSEIDTLYANDRGPDLVVLAQRAS